MTEPGPDREQCAPLLGRSQDLRLLEVDGHPAVEVLCDCATVTRHVWPDELITEAAVGMQIPLTCEGCSTTTWVSIARTEGAT